jgi:hypothetical protein
MRFATTLKGLLLGLALVLSGCTTGSYSYLKAYSGPDLPKNQIALVKPIVDIVVVSIDGNRAYTVTTQQSFGFLDMEIGLPAGQHRFELMLRAESLYSPTPIFLTLNAVPERKYLLNYDFSVGAGSSMSWRAYFEDVTNAPERWCSFASPRAFKRCKVEVRK